MNARYIEQSQPIAKASILSAACIFYLYQLINNWPLINWSGFRGETRYIDLVSVINSAECFKNNSLGIYSETSETPCNGYMYGRSLISIIQVLRIHPDVSFLIGTISALFGIFIVVFLLFKSKVRNSMILILSVTPGLSLLFERGNIDLFIFFAVIISAVAFRFELYGASIITLLIASSLKFYTFPLVFLVILLGKGSKARKAFWTVLSTAIAATVFEQVISSPKVPGTWFISFGIQVFGEYANLGFRLVNQEVALSAIFTIIIGIILVSLSVLLKRTFARPIAASSNSEESVYKSASIVEIVGLFSCTVFVSCYLTGISYDYRIIFYVLAISGLPSIWFKQANFISPLVVVSLVCSTMFSPNLIGERVIFQLVGDVAMLLVAPYLADHYFQLIRGKQKHDN